MALALLAGALLPIPSTLMLWRAMTGQSVTRSWVPLTEIAPSMRAAVVVAEDQAFCRHWGVDPGALREVITDTDGINRGASTITMQTAKNAFLWHGRSYVRKAIEIPLAVVLDRTWGKRRTLEVYLNIVEFGDGVFGVEAAARRYFGTSARSLSADQAARLAASLPNPRLRNPAAGSTRAAANARLIRQRMDRLGDLASCV
jgi:monofunctional biosynthetic peptidoglycan transglycosylase